MQREPASYLDPSTLAGVRSLQLRARMMVEGLMTGMHRSSYQGLSIEFAQHRPYAPGDDIRHLDWKVYARTDKLYIKQYQKETNLDLLILVDRSGSMAYASRSASGWLWRKYDLAASLAATITYLGLRQRDRVGLVLFADEVETLVGVSNAKGHWRSIIGALSRVLVASGSGGETGGETGGDTGGDTGGQTGGDPASDGAGVRGTDLGRLFDQVMAKITHRSLLVLISDLFDDPASLERSMARVSHDGHDMIILQTLDPAEVAFPFRAPSRFIGLEAEGGLAVAPLAIREGYLRALAAHQAQIERAARRYRFDHVLLESSQHLGAPLGRFLARRVSTRVRRGRTG